MVLAQDMAQASQAARVIAAQQYQKDLVQWNKDQIQYEKDVIEYEKNIIKEKEAYDKKIAEQKATYEKNIIQEKIENEKKIAAKKIAAKEAAKIKAQQPSSALLARIKRAEATPYYGGKYGGKGERFNVSIKYLKRKYARSPSNVLRANIIWRQAGGSQRSFQSRLNVDLANIKTSRSASAGLRAAGKQQISTAQRTELARLGRGISPSISTSSKIQRNVSASAIGTVAIKAQNFPKNFQYMSKQQQQQITTSMGITGTGTASDPFVSQQPNVSLVSKYLKPKPKPLESKYQRPKLTTTEPIKPEKTSQTPFEKRKSGITTQAEQAQKAKTAFAEIKKPQEKIQRYTPWTVKGEKGFYTKEAATRYSINNPAVVMAISGTQLLMKSEAKQEIPSLKDLSYVGYSPTGEPYQGAVQPTGYVVTVGGKDRVFLTLASAERFVERISKPISQTSSTPIGFLGELESSLRYADRVDLGDVPKPSDAGQLLQYYASAGLKPITDIAYAGKNIITGDEEPIAPSLPSLFFEQGFEVAQKIWKTGDWTPKVENKIGKYIEEDPIRSIVQLPAEAALWVTGGKAISVGIKAGSKVASKFGITNPVARISGSVEGETIYRGISIQRKPIIGIQQGKIVVGQPKPVVPQLSKASLESRSGGELALGYGAEKSLFYTEKGLGQQVKAGLINPLSKERALAATKLEEASQAAKGGQYKGTIGADSFKSVTEEQGKFLLTKTAQLQKKGQVDIVHGSIATRIAIEPSLKTESGNILRMGDLDINPMRLSKKEIATASKVTKEEKIQGITKETKIKTLEKEKAIDVAKQYEDFPVRVGETFSIKIPKGEGNIGLQLAKQGEPPRKIGEVILLKSEEAVQKGKGDPTSILGYRIPFDKTQTARDFKIKTQTLEFQGLTQTKTTLAYQTYSPTAKLASDVSARAKIYPAAGREKDVLRRYWQGRQSELNQIRSGKPIAATVTRTAAEDFRKLYPELDFNVVPEEKFVLKLSSQITESSPTPRILVTPTIGGGTEIESSSMKGGRTPPITKPVSENLPSMSLIKSTKQPTIKNEITSRTQIKPREQSISIKPKQQESFISKRIESSKSKNIFEEDNSLELYSSYKQSQSIGSSKPQSIGTKASSFLQSFTSRKPISAKSKVPVSSKPSVTSRPSSRPSLRPTLRGKPSFRISSKASVQSGISITVRVPKKTVIPIIMALKSTEKKRKKKEKGQKDFLGNTRTDRFVGLINRKEILVGDKLTARQIKLDKKLVVNPKPPRSRKRTRKKDSDNPIAKGFKI